MSGEVKRYEVAECFVIGGCSEMQESPSGHYVEHSDYAAMAAELENLTAKHKVARIQLETSLRANEQLRAELAAIKGKSGFDYSIRTQSTNRIPVPSQEIRFNSQDQLPPVDTPLLIELEAGRLVEATRTSFVEKRDRDMEYRLADGSTIVGRYRWTYP